MNKYQIISAVISCLLLALSLSAILMGTVGGEDFHELFLPIADTCVKEAHPSSNYDQFAMDVGLLSEDYPSRNEAYVMFDLSEIPEDASILESHVDLPVFGYNLPEIDGESQPMGVGVYYCPDVSWNERTLTWENKPPSWENPTDTVVYGPGQFDRPPMNVTEDAQRAFQTVDKKLTVIIKYEGNQPANITYCPKEITAPHAPSPAISIHYFSLSAPPNEPNGALDRTLGFATASAVAIILLGTAIYLMNRKPKITTEKG